MGGGCDSVKAIKGIFSTARYMSQMGCETAVIKGKLEPDPRQLWIDGQMLRGKFIDAFARLESSVAEFLVRLEFKAAPRAPFSNKLKYLAASRDRFCHPGKLDARLAAIGSLNEVRADMAHAELTIIIQYGEANAIEHWLGFKSASQGDKPLRAITPEQIKQMTADANRLASQFGQQQLKATTPVAPASASV